MLDAGSLSLVLLAYINEDYPLRILFEYSSQRGGTRGNWMQPSGYNFANVSVACIPMDVINVEASALTALVQRTAFCAT